MKGIGSHNIAKLFSVLLVRFNLEQNKTAPCEKTESSFLFLHQFKEFRRIFMLLCYLADDTI